MTQDDQQPERTPGSRISRDTLLLLGALTFLILAVALTFLFTPNTGTNNNQPTDTVTAGLPTPSPGSGSPYPGPTQPVGSGGSPYPVGGTVISGTTPGVVGVAPTTPGGRPYPGPGASQDRTTTTGLPNTIPTGDISLEASPTTQPAGGAQPSPSPLPTNATSPAYPGPVGEGTPPSLPTLNPTVSQPTSAPPPTSAPQATATTAPFVPPPTQPPPPTTPPPTTQPTDELSLELTPTSEAEVTQTVAPPPPPPADVLRGNVRWATGQSPIILRRDVQIAPGAELIIEPGVEVRLDPGVSIYVDGGRLLALGLPGQPVRFVGATGARWSGLFSRPNSFVVLENTEVRGGGAGGTVLAADRGEMVIRASRFHDNGGAILLTDTRLEMRDSDVSGNDVPIGPTLLATYGRGSFITLQGNRFGGNRLNDGAPQVRISNTSTFETLNLTIDGNLMRGGAPNLELVTNGPLNGAVQCNALVGDGLGLGLRTQTPQVAPNGLPPMALRVESNFIDEHVPPIIPVYLRYGLGRGATSEILIDMRNNWWGEASGPYEPDANPLGRGDSVGVNITYAPWLTEPPPCAPR